MMKTHYNSNQPTLTAMEQKGTNVSHSSRTKISRFVEIACSTSLEAM